MPTLIRLAVDASGGDSGLHTVVSASARFVQVNPFVRLTLVGQVDALRDLVPRHDQISCLDAADIVTMSDRPAFALRNKTNSSMAKAVQLVAKGEADACISAGNTGALMAFGLKYLGTLPDISRPAICKAVPNIHGICYLLDLGANLSATAVQLQQFAVMGASMAQIGGKEQPRVGLLNVGREPQKGGDLQQRAAELMDNTPGLFYHGFVEGGDIFTGRADVIVCDGYTGNTLLKASEGVTTLLGRDLDQRFHRSPLARLAGWLASPYLAEWRQANDPTSLNGAALLGLKGIVVKSHGAASDTGFMSALQVAFDQASNNIPRLIAESVQRTIRTGGGNGEK